MRSAGEARGYLPVKEEPAASKVPIKAAKPAHEPNMSGIDLTVGERKERGKRKRLLEGSNQVGFVSNSSRLSLGFVSEESLS